VIDRATEIARSTVPTEQVCAHTGDDSEAKAIHCK